MGKNNAILDAIGTMSEEELDKLYEVAKKELGGDKINLDIFCPTNFTKWWSEATKSDKDCLQLLFSRYCLSLVLSAQSTDGDDFNLRCSIALAIINGDISIVDWSKEMMEEMEDNGNDDKDTGDKTFH